MRTAILKHDNLTKSYDFDMVESFLKNSPKATSIIAEIREAEYSEVKRIAALGFGDIEVNERFDIYPKCSIDFACFIAFDKGRKKIEISRSSFSDKIEVRSYEKNYDRSITKIFELSYINDTNTPKVIVDALDAFKESVDRSVNELQAAIAADLLKSENEILKQRVAFLERKIDELTDGLPDSED